MSEKPLLSTRPEVLQHAMQETEGLHESIYQAYSDLIKSKDFVYEGDPEQGQVNLVGFLPLMYRRGGFETQSVLFGLKDPNEWLMNSVHKPNPRPELAELAGDITDLTVAAIEDGSASAPSTIARKSDSGLIGGVVILHDPGENKVQRLHFWHKDFIGNLKEQISEADDAIESGVLSDDAEFTMIEFSFRNLLSGVSKFLADNPDKAKSNMIDTLLTRATELGPLALVPTAGLNTIPNPNSK